MTILSIPDMSCGHCTAAIEKALGTLPGVASIRVDLPNRRATVEGSATAATLIAALDQIGFPAQIAG